MLTVIILTKNSTKTILPCLNSIKKLADEILIIDDFSTDNTLKKIKQFSFQIKSKNFIKIFQRKLENNFASQRNFALKKAKGDWLLFLDSDEYLSPNLQIEVQQIICHPELVSGSQQFNNLTMKQCDWEAFYIPRKTKFLGKILNHGETCKTKILRLAQKNSGEWQGRVHEIWKIKGKTKILKNSIIHNQNISISEFITRIDKYSDLKAQELFDQQSKEPFNYIFLFPFAKFFQNYFLRLGFLDGFPGFVLSCLMSFHSLLVRLKLRLLYLTS